MWYQLMEHVMETKKTVIQKINAILKKYHLIKWSIFLTLVLSLCFSLYLLFLAKTTNVSTLKSSLEQATIIYDDKGEEVGQLKEQKGTYVSLDKISPHVIDALLATEDRRFYEHSGVDYLGIGRSIVGFLFNGFKVSGGGSTLTQQLAKNSYLTQKQTIIRKAQELFLALEIERKYSKNDILTMYLNHAYFGNGVWGIEDASKKYFGISANQLSMPQAAVLVGILKGPGIYNPIEHMDNAINRRNIVLNATKEYGKISQEAYEKFVQEKIILKDKYDSKASYKYPYFFDSVITEIEQNYNISEEDILTKGYKIYTTLNVDYQKQLDLTYTKKVFPNDTVQSATVVLDSLNGAVKAIVGGRGEHVFRGFNRATQMQRQPGSTMKPFIYTLALESGYTENSIVLDEVKTYGDYTPENANKKSVGNIPLYKALVESKNTTAVWLLNKLGLQEGINKIKLFGIPLEQEDQYVGVALGGLTKGVSPITMASAYTAFANNGVRSQPYFVTKIVDASGQIIFNKQNTNQNRVMSNDIARDMTKMMIGVFEEGGTGSSIQVKSPLQIAGKTGTTDEYKDQWIIAYTPDFVLTTWMGYDKDTGQSLSSQYNQGIYAFANTAINNVISVSPKTKFNLTSTTTQQKEMEQKKSENSLLESAKNIWNAIPNALKNTWDATTNFFSNLWH